MTGFDLISPKTRLRDLPTADLKQQRRIDIKDKEQGLIKRIHALKEQYNQARADYETLRESYMAADPVLKMLAARRAELDAEVARGNELIRENISKECHRTREIVNMPELSEALRRMDDWASRIKDTEEVLAEVVHELIEDRLNGECTGTMRTDCTDTGTADGCRSSLQGGGGGSTKNKPASARPKKRKE